VTKSKAIIPENPLLVLPTLAVEIGLNEAIILQQMHFWLITSEHFYEGQFWIYNSYSQWQKKNFPFWSVSTIKKTIQNLDLCQNLRSRRNSNESIKRNRT